MNLKKTFVSLMAAGAILAGGFGGATAQTPITTTGTVTVSGTGTFVPSFCKAVNLDAVTVTSATGATSTGVMSICVVDDKAYRGEVNMSVSAGDFASTDSTINATIDAKNFAITKTYNPLQGRWSSGVCGSFNGTPSGQPGSNRPCVGDPAGLANNGATRVTSGSVTWDTPGSLAESGQPVLHFYNGSGTSAADGAIGTRADFDVQLTVPGGQRPTTYQSTLTLTVNPLNP